MEIFSMDDRTIAKNVINTLLEDGFFVECPCCKDSIPLDQCGLFALDDFTPAALAIYEQYKQSLENREAKLLQRREKFGEESESLARATNLGLLWERLAPSLSGFRFQCGDCRSLFDPIDYLIFEDLCRTGSVSRIIFAEIKTGGSELTKSERKIRDAVRAKKVEFEIYEAAK